MRADLTATAASNAATRRADAASVLLGDASGRVGRFRDFVATESRFSSNVAADKVVAFEEAGEILDTRRYCVHRAGGDEPAGLREFASVQGGWLVRRESFEDMWEHGRRFVYGAVNAGGMGTEGRFGSWCLVADPEQPMPDALGVFPGDSAQRYTDDAGAVDGPGATAEVTAWSERADLGVVAKGTDALTAGEDAWPDVVCGPGRYLEVTRAGVLPVSACSEVRLRAALRGRLDDLWAREEAGEVLPVLEENEVAAYRVVHGWRRANGSSVTDVA